MINGSKCLKQTTSVVVALSCIALSAIGGADNVVQKRNVANQDLFFAPVPKAVCGPGDNPETGLQGQVPYALRVQPGGFQGFNCNLQLIGQVRGEGANWQSAEFREGRGKSKKVCAYHGTAAPSYPPSQGLNRQNYGVRVIDVSDPAKPYNTTYLTTSAMLDPWESLKVNERRQALGAVNAQNGGLNPQNGGPEIDIYDISGDCRYPQLLADTPVIATDQHPIFGHEGNWAPDGLTYYGSDIQYVGPNNPVPGNRGQWYAIDTTDMTKPKYIYSWQTGVPGATIHGLSVREDGLRGYMTSLGSTPVQSLLDDSVPANNGLLIYDLTQIENRTANPTVPLISSLFWKDGATAQHTIHITSRGKPYLVFVDEAGAAGNTVATRQAACDAGMAPFPMARIIDISDERNPAIISKLMLEIHDPANCPQVTPDLVGLTSFLYGSHYCSVDNIRRPTTLACGYLNSGIRVFDIRDVYHPYEIAYYNPPAPSTVSPGSNHITQRMTQQPGGPDWCSSQLHMDAEQGTIWTTCQDNGLVSLKFTHNAWPFANSTTPPGLQN